MSQSSTKFVSVSSPNSEHGTLAERMAQAAALSPEQQQALESSPMWAKATPAERALLITDCRCCMSDELEMGEYLEGLAEWPGSVRSYLAESDLVPSEEPVEAQPEAEEPAPTAAELEAADKALNAVLDRAVAAYARSENAQRVGYLESGRLLSEYVAGRVKLAGPKARAAAVTTAAGDLNRYSSTLVEAATVNRLMGSYHAYRLLTEDTTLADKPAKGKPAPADAVPYGHYRDAWVKLVTKDDAEVWSLFPLDADLRSKAKSEYARLVAIANTKDGLPLAVTTDVVTGLLRELAAYQQGRAVAAASVAKQAAAQGKQASADAVTEQLRIGQETEAALLREKQARESNQEEARKQAAADLVALKAQQEAARKDAAEKQAAADKLAREQADADKAAKQADADLAKANAPKPPAKPKTKANPVVQETTVVKPAEAPKPEECKAENLLKTLASMASKSPKDTAQSLAEVIHHDEAPLLLIATLIKALLVVPAPKKGELVDYTSADVLDEVLDALSSSPELGSKAKRAIKAAQAVLLEKAAPSANGQSRMPAVA